MGQKNRKKSETPSSDSDSSDSTSASDTSSGTSGTTSSEDSSSSASSVSTTPKKKTKRPRSEDKESPRRRRSKLETIPPSRTLFVSHIPVGTTERELGHIFRPYPGVESIRFSLGNNTVCFVQFKYIDDAKWCKRDLGNEYIFDIGDPEKAVLRINYSNSKYSK